MGLALSAPSSLARSTEAVKARVAPPAVEKPELVELTPDLASYDALIAGVGR